MLGLLTMVLRTAMHPLPFLQMGLGQICSGLPLRCQITALRSLRNNQAAHETGC